VPFLSCKANARVKLAKTGHGPRSSTLVVICVVIWLFVLFYVLFVCKCVLPPGDNPVAVNKYIIYLGDCKKQQRVQNYCIWLLRLWEICKRILSNEKSFPDNCISNISTGFEVTYVIITCLLDTSN
jgi:hypothetical protein